VEPRTRSKLVVWIVTAAVTDVRADDVLACFRLSARPRATPTPSIAEEFW
jgi:hypothetical protein